MLRTVLSATGLVLAVGGFVLFVALGVGAWVAKREADRQVAAAAATAHQAEDVAARVIALVREIIARAQAGLAAARAEPMEPAGAKQDPLVQFALRKAKRDLPADVERARDAVGTASEAVIIADAALGVFEQQPREGSALGVRPEDLHAARSQLDAASLDLRNARRVLGVPIPGPDRPTTPEQLDNADAALARATEVTDALDRALGMAREKVDAAQQTAEVWSLRVALAVSALAGLAAIGQVFMARACWRGLRRVTAV